MPAVMKIRESMTVCGKTPIVMHKENELYKAVNEMRLLNTLHAKRCMHFIILKC